MERVRGRREKAGNGGGVACGPEILRIGMEFTWNGRRAVIASRQRVRVGVVLKPQNPMRTKSENLAEFFQKGKTVILPIDHGTAIPVPGLEHPGDLIAALSPHVDGFVVNLGVARAFSKALKGKGFCLRTDVYKPPFEGNPDRGSYRVYGAEEALDIGAQAMMNMLYAHHVNEERMVRECAGLIAGGLQRGVPLIIEALPFGIGRPVDYTVENISFATRMAAELGADVVKTAYPGDRDGFARIVDACPVPVIVLGGSAMGDDAGLLGMVEDAIAAGASGIAIGRNVWQHANPVGIARALNAVVHGGASAAEALVLVDP